MTVSGRAKVALLRLKTMQRISDDGCFASLPCHLLSGPCLPKPLLHRRLSTHCHRVLTYIHTRPILAAPEEQDDDEPDPPVPENMEALAHFIFTRIRKGRCALHAL